MKTRRQTMQILQFCSRHVIMTGKHSSIYIYIYILYSRMFMFRIYTLHRRQPACTELSFWLCILCIDEAEVNTFCLKPVHARNVSSCAQRT